MYGYVVLELCIFPAKSELEMKRTWVRLAKAYDMRGDGLKI